MKLPKKITLWLDVDGEINTDMKHGDDVPVSYVPASEAEALRERVKELVVRELQLHGLLGEAAGYIKGQTEGHFHAMGKAYLAKEHLENNSLLKRIGEALGGGEGK